VSNDFTAKVVTMFSDKLIDDIIKAPQKLLEVKPSGKKGKAVYDDVVSLNDLRTMVL
jgi:hypothetical protein